MKKKILEFSNSVTASSNREQRRVRFFTANLTDHHVSVTSSDEGLPPQRQRHLGGRWRNYTEKHDKFGKKSVF